ncbi:hypothetical protein [Micromonospora ureilytica]|uniref:hypothetical protein n=1 Tax=Micromonospora ureilytica TaxID=709868 RepID=UPI00403A17E5
MPLTVTPPPEAPSGITAGDWLGAIVGTASLLATIVLAILVYRLQRRDSQAEKLEVQLQQIEDRKLEEEQREKQRQEDEQRAHEQREREEERSRQQIEREQRAIRRERNKEEFFAATRALNAISDLLNELENELLGAGDARAEKIKEAGNTLERISERTRELSALGLVGTTAAYYHACVESMPSNRVLRDAAQEAMAPNGSAAEFNRTLRVLALNSMDQTRARRELLSEIRNARKSLEREWGD